MASTASLILASFNVWRRRAGSRQRAGSSPPKGIIMRKVANAQAHKPRFLNTTVLTVCFAAWVMNVLLVTWLAPSDVLDWGAIEIGWLMGIPVMAGSLASLMLVLFDKQRRRTLSRCLLEASVAVFGASPAAR